MVSSAWAVRPDEGGMFSFDDTDVLEYVDSPDGLVRVHYSVEGPNVTLLEDDDGDGFPDYPQEVAATAESVLEFYEGMGFLAPLSEEEMGLGELGGSYAFDFYLVDFGHNSDGQFTTDKCSGGVCSGFMSMENDFSGYGYSSLSYAVEVLTSHELFHAVQSAYTDGEPSWMSEGTAVWAEWQFIPGNNDFLGFCDAYLDDVGRTIDSPPAGSVTAFSYGTALFFQFLTERLGADAGPLLQSYMVGRGEDDARDAIIDTIEALGSTLPEQWASFVRWNLATGRRAGVAESYPFAEELRGIKAEADGDALHDDNRFYPLAATYYRIDHAGGDLYFASVDAPTGVVFTLHQVDGGDDDGPVTDRVADWAPTAEGTVDLGSFDAGGYWLVGSYPENADQSTKIEFCLGDAAAAEECVPGTDTGDTGDIGDSADSGDSGGDDKKGCGCSTSGGAGGLAGLWLLGLFAVGRRRR